MWDLVQHLLQTGCYTPFEGYLLAAAFTAEEIEQAADKLTDEERHDLIHRYCHGCGCLDTSCRCWDDS